MQINMKCVINCVLIMTVFPVCLADVLACQEKLEADYYTIDGCVVAFDQTPPMLEVTPNFKIQGKFMNSIFKDGRIEAYQGIRFGRAQRFAIATMEPFIKANTILCANHLGYKCPQSSMVGAAKCAGKEDCLYLNIYRPTGTTETNNLPVMFFIYGGAFTSGDSSMYLPTKLLDDHDVILVTIHYRLGAFGFYTLGIEETYGNYALYDQHVALKWVQANIGYFGGNKDKVTIFGESAGSVSTTWQYISPLSRGLFSGAIAESGSALEHWGLDLDPDFAAEWNSNDCGCLESLDFDIDKVEIYNCMLDCPVQTLKKSQRQLVSHDRHSGLMGFRGAAPTIQSNVTVPKNMIMIEKSAMEYLEAKDYADVPFMIGANKQEGSYVVGIMINSYYKYHGLNVTYLREEAINDILRTFGTEDNPHSLSNSLQMEYCPGIDLGEYNASYPCFVDLLSGAIALLAAMRPKLNSPSDSYQLVALSGYLIAGVMVGVLFLKAGGWEMCNVLSFYETPAYYYSFDFPSDDTMFLWIQGYTEFDTGITHADELMYLFSMPAIMDENQIYTMKRMTEIWTNFATYGEPTPDDGPNHWQELGIPKILPYKFEDHHYVLIKEEITLQKEYTERWTISVDEIRENGNETMSSTWPTETTSDNGVCCDCDECESYQNQRDISMISMIVLVVLFVMCWCGIAVIWFQEKKKLLV